jgi:hypothetical protein
MGIQGAGFFPDVVQVHLPLHVPLKGTALGVGYLAADEDDQHRAQHGAQQKTLPVKTEFPRFHDSPP